MKCCLLELESETASEQCSLACEGLGGRKREDEGPNANASLVMKGYPLLLVCASYFAMYRRHMSKFAAPSLPRQ